MQRSFVCSIIPGVPSSLNRLFAVVHGIDSSMRCVVYNPGLARPMPSQSITTDHVGGLDQELVLCEKETNRRGILLHFGRGDG